GIAARQVRVAIRLVLSLRPDRTVRPFGKIPMRLAHRVSVRLVFLHLKAPAPAPAHPSNPRAPPDPNGLPPPPPRTCWRENRATVRPDRRPCGRSRTAG